MRRLLAEGGCANEAARQAALQPGSDWLTAGRTFPRVGNSGVPGGGSAAFEAALGRAEVSGVEEVAAVRAESGLEGPEARFCARLAVAPPGCGHGTQRRLPPREATAGPGGRARGECHARRSRAAGKGSWACAPSSESSAR